MSSEDIIVLIISSLGYLIWPLCRVLLKAGHSWTDAILLIIFCTTTIISGCSIVTMYVSFHSKHPLNDAGDLIMVVWGLGFLAAIASVMVNSGA